MERLIVTERFLNPLISLGKVTKSAEVRLKQNGRILEKMGEEFKLTMEKMDEGFRLIARLIVEENEKTRKEILEALKSSKEGVR